MNADGENVKRLTHNVLGSGSFASRPSWSPDDNQIIFNGRKKGGNWEIYLFDLKTHQVINLTNHPATGGLADWWNSSLPVEFGILHPTLWSRIKFQGKE